MNHISSYCLEIKGLLKQVLITLSALLLSVGINAQIFESVHAYGDIYYDGGEAVAVDDLGNLYAAGFFKGSIDFDPGPGTYTLSSAGYWDGFLQKLDSAGNLLWANSIGGINANIEGHSIAIDDSGSIYVAGRFKGTVDFDPGVGSTILTSAGKFDFFIQKLDALGNLIWVHSFGDDEDDSPTDIKIDGLGNIIITGYFEGTVDFDPGLGVLNLTTISNQPDCFIQKLDASGSLLWAKSFGGTSEDEAFSVTSDASGNIYSTGTFDGPVDFDPGPGVFNVTTSGNYIQKLDSAGNFLWVRTYSTAMINGGMSIEVDPVGNPVTMGNFNGLLDFDPGPGIAYAGHLSSTSRQIFVLKLNPSGDFIWVKAFGNEAKAMVLDNSGDVYVTGYFLNTVDFDPEQGVYNLTAIGGRDGFIHKLDSAGNFMWVRSFGGILDDRGDAITVSANGNMYLTGGFRGTADFDPSQATEYRISSGQRDIFVLKLSPCPLYSSLHTETSCGSYTWPVNSTTYTSSGIYSTTFTSAIGCDSVITLDLTINNVSDITTNLSGATIEANNPNATYQWLVCNNNYSILPGETNQSFTATTNGSYSVELTENGCVDTSDCITILNVGTAENALGEKFVIYPNPTKGNFSIDLGTQHDHIEVSVSDVFGRVIYKKLFFKSRAVDLSIEEPSGVYIVSVETDNNKSFIRLIKE